VRRARRALASLLSFPLAGRRQRRAAAGFFLLVAGALASGLPRLALDGSPERFFVEDHAALEEYRQLEMRFGRDRVLRVAVAGPGLWSASGLDWLAALETRLDALPAVFGAAGLHRHAAARGVWSPGDPERLRRWALADPVAREVGWIAADGSLASVLVALPQLDAARQRTLLGEIEALLATAPPGVATWTGGLPVVQRALEQEARATMTRFFPALVALTAAALLALFRSPRQVAALLLFVAVSEAGTLGAMGWAGARLDLVSVLLVPLLFVVATATGVHLLVRFRHLREAGLAPPRAARILLGQKAWPVLWGGLTTTAGFGSLVVAPIPAVRTLGGWAAFGFLWTLLAALVLLPALLAGEAPAAGAGRLPWSPALRRLGRRWAAAAVRRRRLVIAVAAALALVAAAGVLRLRVESDVLGYLPPAHPVRAAVAAFEGAGIGVVSADLVLHRRRGDRRFDETEELARLERLALQLRGQPETLGVLAASDLAATVAAATRRGDASGPATGDGSSTPTAAAPEAVREHLLLATLLTAAGDRTRLVLSLPMRGARDLEPLLAGARQEAERHFPDAEVEVTGRYPLVLRAQRALLPIMGTSLAVAGLLVAVALRASLGSGRLALRALAPNLWPVLVALGVMGWAKVPLDSTTVAVAAVALGLVVDDTFHTFADFRRCARRRGAPAAAVAALGRNAPAHAVTALLLAGGFALFGLSGFVPAARFGPLTAVAISAALAADLLLVPALLGAAATPASASAAARSRRP
jgi:uncharacterized protein